MGCALQSILAKFNCHIIVEICYTIRAVKYLYKYIYKGHYRIVLNLTDQESLESIDEIESH